MCAETPMFRWKRNRLTSSSVSSYVGYSFSNTGSSEPSVGFTAAAVAAFRRAERDQRRDESGDAECSRGYGRVRRQAWKMVEPNIAAGELDVVNGEQGSPG